MNDEDKTKERLIHELVELRRRIAELETSGGECKQIEEALAKVAAEQKNIMGTISDGIYMLDMSGNLVNWNKAAEVVTGLSAEELMDKPVEELFAEEDRAAVTEAIRKGLKEGTGEVTGSFLRKDRSPAIYQWSTVPLKDPQGKVIGLTGVGRDITEQKRIEEELARIAAEQKNIMGTISDGIYMLDMSGNLVNWNRAAEVVSGLSAKELTGKPIVELFAEEDRASVAEAITKGLEEGIGEVTGSFLRKGRSPAIYQWSTVPLKDPQGKVIGLTGVGRDITEQKRIEEELARIAAEQKNIMGTISDGIYMLDMNGNLVNWNTAAETVSGLSAKELTGKPAVELFAEKDRAAVAEAIRKGLEEGIGEVTGSFLRKDRSPAIYQWSTVPLKNPQGKVIGLTGVGRDITERKRAEEKLRKHRDQLEELVGERTAELRRSNEELQEEITERKEMQQQLVRKEKLAVLGQLSGGVGHELRNPLGVISNAVYFLQMTLSDADETTSEYLGIISSEVRTAEKIVLDLLDFSRVKSLEREKIAISDLIDQVLEKQPPPEKVEVNTEILPELPPVFVDPRQIVQVLVNLVTNGYQAMPEGGELMITARAERSHVNLHITDTGCGISRENLKKIFEPLFTTKARGIGLGLAVSKSLMEANGGSLGVESEEGKGSTFTVTLPTRKGQA